MGSNIRTLADLTPNTAHFVASLGIVVAVLIVIICCGYLVASAMHADSQPSSPYARPSDGVGEVTGAWLTGRAMAERVADHQAAHVRESGRHSAGAKP